jgi:hypothetical protein
MDIDADITLQADEVVEWSGDYYQKVDDWWVRLIIDNDYRDGDWEEHGGEWWMLFDGWWRRATEDWKSSPWYNKDEALGG